jgi:hypothetical protein
MLLGVAAGQSEALVPMITQEIFFLHERARFLMIQQTIQTIAVAIFVLFASPIAEAIGPQWWYGIGCCLCGVCFVISLFFVPETKYYRPQSSYQETTAEGDSDSSGEGYRIHTERPALDFDRYEARTFQSSMRLWIGKPEWGKAWVVFKDAWTMILFPNVFWALTINGITLGANIAIGMTVSIHIWIIKVLYLLTPSKYGRIVESPPYNWPHSSTSYSNTGQIVTSLVGKSRQLFRLQSLTDANSYISALPVYGYGSDWIIKYFAKRRGGIHEPETRLLPLFAPVVIGVITLVLYGQGATHPENYHWFTYVWALAAYFFTFIGANIVAITYLLDAYPQRASSLLIIICAHRGFLSFGVSFRVWDMIDAMGYDGAFNMFAGLTALMGVLGGVLFLTGKRIRSFTSRWVTVNDKQE